MHTFIVTIKTACGYHHEFVAIGRNAIDVHLETLNQFGICAVTVRPIKAAA